MELIITIINSN